MGADGDRDQAQGEMGEGFEPDQGVGIEESEARMAHQDAGQDLARDTGQPQALSDPAQGNAGQDHDGQGKQWPPLTQEF